MTPEEILDYAIDGSKKYYRYLQENGGGRCTITVLSKTKNSVNGYDLRLNKHYIDDANTYIIVDSVKYNNNQLRIQKYNKIRKTLTVVPSVEIEDIFERTPADKIFIESDLLFLVERTIKWYQNKKQQGWKPGIPVCKNEVTDLSVSEHETRNPSGEQLSCIRSIMTNPFTYVWGAPGTGKTRFVLSQCVLNYINANRKVVIMAPTNVALEQTLFGVLNVLESEKISPELVLRLGTPSESFCDAYPMCCEVRGLEEKLREIAEEIKLYENRLKEYDRLCSESEIVQSLIDALILLKQNVTDEMKKHDIYDRDLRRLQAEREEAACAQARLSEQLTAQTQRIDDLKSKRREFKFLFCELFKLSYYKETEAVFLSEQNVLSDLQSAYAASCEACKSLDAKITTAKALTDNHDRERMLFSSFLDDAIRLGFLPADAKRDMLFSYSFGNVLLRQTDTLLETFRAVSDETTDKMKNILPCSKSELLYKIELLGSQLQNLAENSLSERIKKAAVISMTTDAFLARGQIFEDAGIYISHIFIDEAGYCSLIKGLPALSLDCPVAMLGDHLQLPPICELSDIEISHNNRLPVCLWIIPLLYCENVFCESLDELFQLYQSNETPIFQDLVRTSLNVTYRFGENLSDILAEYIYSDMNPPFKSGLNSDHTKIILLNAPKTGINGNRENIAEARLIAKYLRHGVQNDFIILTPYRAQVNLLRRTLNGIVDTSAVMTVHAAQGQEWETVLFSVCDSSDDEIFFTDSNHAIGKSVLNTAFSRAKKELIIVCDADSWRNKEHQLIGDLIRNSEFEEKE